MSSLNEPTRTALAAMPTWPHSRKWGYYPSGGLGIILVILKK